MFNRIDDQFIGTNDFCWFIGAVEDIDDPKTMNRVRVRAFGYHTDNKNIVSSQDLPWSTVMMPNTSASYKGIGSNHGLLVGSWVVGFFRDGRSMQDAIILGSIATMTDNVIDIPIEAQHQKPFNNVQKTQGGHVIEYDNTPDNKQINIKHSSGTSINIDNDGTVSINAVNDVVNIDGNVTVTGSIHATKDISTDAGQGITLATHEHEYTYPARPAGIRNTSKGK